MPVKRIPGSKDHRPGTDAYCGGGVLEVLVALLVFVLLVLLVVAVIVRRITGFRRFLLTKLVRRITGFRRFLLTKLVRRNFTRERGENGSTAGGWVKETEAYIAEVTFRASR